MPSNTIFANDLTPYTPIVDERRFVKPGIVGGRNFLHDVDGPRSAFGSKYADYNYFPIKARKRIVSFRVANSFFYGTSEGLFRLNPVSKILEPIFDVKITNDYWPWTMGVAGNLYYFAQWNVGLWQFNALTNTVAKISTPVGDNVLGVCGSNARLVILSDDLVSWTSIDDGTDFVPSLETGAGAQVLSMVGGVPYRVDAVSDGFIVATSAGLLKGEVVQAAYVWHFYVRSNDVQIFSPNAATYINDVGMVYLDKSGFHATDGAPVQPWQQEMGVWLKDNVLEDMDETKLGCLDIFYSRAGRMFFASSAPNEQEGRFNQAQVLYLPSGNWSLFSEAHRGFLETLQNNDNVPTTSYVYVDGYVKALTDAPYSVLVRAPHVADRHLLYDILYRPQTEADCLSVISETKQQAFLGFSEFTLSDIDPALYDPIEEIELLLKNDDGSVVPFQPYQQGLNSILDLGVFAFDTGQSSEETSKVDDITIGCKKAIPYEAMIVTDQNEGDDTVTINQNQTDGMDDLGSIAAIPNVFLLELLDTNDGYNEPIVGWTPLTEVERIGASVRYKPPGFSSVFHRLRLSATNPGDCFALKYVKIAGTTTGRLS